MKRFYDHIQLRFIIEALLFVSHRPLSAEQIRSILPDVDIKDIRRSLKTLFHEYEAMGRSFRLKEVAGGYQFTTRPQFAAYILRMLKKAPTRFSSATMETLAIIAYRQPITRQEIEEIRGVDVGGILRNLLEKDLIRITGRKKVPGRPLLYGTTKRFLEVFNLKDLASLPKLKEIREILGKKGSFKEEDLQKSLFDRDERDKDK